MVENISFAVFTITLVISFQANKKTKVMRIRYFSEGILAFLICIVILKIAEATRDTTRGNRKIFRQKLTI